MGITKKEIFGPMLVLAITICFLALCAIFYCAQGLTPYLRDATTAFFTAMIGGLAAGMYLNIIGMRDQRDN